MTKKDLLNDLMLQIECDLVATETLLLSIIKKLCRIEKNELYLLYEGRGNHVNCHTMMEFVQSEGYDVRLRMKWPVIRERMRAYKAKINYKIPNEVFDGEKKYTNFNTVIRGVEDGSIKKKNIPKEIYIALQVIFQFLQPFLSFVVSRFKGNSAEYVA